MIRYVNVALLLSHHKHLFGVFCLKQNKMFSIYSTSIRKLLISVNQSIIFMDLTFIHNNSKPSLLQNLDELIERNREFEATRWKNRTRIFDIFCMVINWDSQSFGVRAKEWRESVEKFIDEYLSSEWANESFSFVVWGVKLTLIKVRHEGENERDQNIWSRCHIQWSKWTWWCFDCKYWIKFHSKLITSNWSLRFVPL